MVELKRLFTTPSLPKKTQGGSTLHLAPWDERGKEALSDGYFAEPIVTPP